MLSVSDLTKKVERVAEKQERMQSQLDLNTESINTWNVKFDETNQLASRGGNYSMIY